MTEKVKLTQEQAEAIGDVITYGTKEEAVESHIEKGWSFKEYLCLNALSTDEFIRALYIGYEVEETFKVGDWVVRKEDLLVATVHSVEGEFKVNITSHEIPQVQLRSWYRPATPEEIAKEKQRRWWARHGRNVYEFKIGDLIKCEDITSEVEEVEEKIIWVKFNKSKGTYTEEYYNHIKVICFAEDRKDLEGDEE